MSRSADTLSRGDLELLRRALVFRRKRVHDQAALVRLQGILDRVEALVLDQGQASALPAEEARSAGEATSRSRSGSGALRLSPPEVDLLGREIPLYCAEMTGRGSSPAAVAEAGRLDELLRLLAGRRRRSGMAGRLWRWLRRG